MQPDTWPNKATQSTLTTRTLLSAERPSATQAVRSWVWPLPSVHGISPSIKSASDEQGAGIIEIGYPVASSIVTPIPVLASRSGIITYAAFTMSGAALCLHHPDGWSTQYECLADLAVVPTDRFRRSHRVHRGTVLGYLHHVPLHIRFSLSRLAEHRMRVLDPVPHLSRWHVLSWSHAKQGRKRLPG